MRLSLTCIATFPIAWIRLAGLAPRGNGAPTLKRQPAKVMQDKESLRVARQSDSSAGSPGAWPQAPLRERRGCGRYAADDEVCPLGRRADGEVVCPVQRQLAALRLLSDVHRRARISARHLSAEPGRDGLAQSHLRMMETRDQAAFSVCPYSKRSPEPSVIWQGRHQRLELRPDAGERRRRPLRYVRTMPNLL